MNFKIVCIVCIALGVVGSSIYLQVPPSGVYACSDKENNPPDVQHQCKRLTRGQWWHQ